LSRLEMAALFYDLFQNGAGPGVQVGVKCASGAGLNAAAAIINHLFEDLSAAAGLVDGPRAWLRTCEA
jgi:hypothetical protein